MITTNKVINSLNYFSLRVYYWTTQSMTTYQLLFHKIWTKDKKLIWILLTRRMHWIVETKFLTLNCYHRIKVFSLYFLVKSQLSGACHEKPCILKCNIIIIMHKGRGAILRFESQKVISPSCLSFGGKLLVAFPLKSIPTSRFIARPDFSYSPRAAAVGWWWTMAVMWRGNLKRWTCCYNAIELQHRP